MITALHFQYGGEHCRRKHKYWSSHVKIFRLSYFYTFTFFPSLSSFKKAFCYNVNVRTWSVPFQASSTRVGECNSPTVFVASINHPLRQSPVCTFHRHIENLLTVVLGTDRRSAHSRQRQIRLGRRTYHRNTRVHLKSRPFTKYYLELRDLTTHRSSLPLGIKSNFTRLRAPRQMSSAQKTSVTVHNNPVACYIYVSASDSNLSCLIPVSP